MWRRFFNCVANVLLTFEHTGIQRTFGLWDAGHTVEYCHGYEQVHFVFLWVVGFGLRDAGLTSRLLPRLRAGGFFFVFFLECRTHLLSAAMGTCF